MLHQALTRSLRESKVQFVVEDTWPFRQRASEQNGRLNPLRMDITTEAGALFDNQPRLKNKALLLDITIVNPCAGSNLGNAARHVGKHLADVVERKKNKYRGSLPATYSLPLAMSTCGDVGSDVHALIKELAIRRVQHVLQQALSFRTLHHLCRQGVALASTRRPHSQGPASVQAHRTGGVTGSEGQEGANGVGGVLESGVGTETVTGTWTVMGTGTERERERGMEVNKGVQDGNGDGAGAGTGTGVGTRSRTSDGNGNGDGDGSEDCSGDGNGDGDNGNENRFGEGGREAKKRKKPQNSCRRRAGNGGDMGGKRKKCRKERVGSVAANPDNLGSNREAGGGGQGAQGSSKICTSRESVSVPFVASDQRFS